MKRRSLLIALAAPCFAAAQEQTVVFASGKVEVVLPSAARITSNKEQTLVAVFGPEGDRKLELTLHEYLQSAPTSDAAERFVREQAQRKGRRLQEVPGKTLLLEPGGDFNEGGKSFRTLR